MSGHTPMPETVSKVKDSIIVHQGGNGSQGGRPIPEIHSLIRQACRISNRRTLRDNLPILAKPVDGRNILGTLFTQLGYATGAEIGTRVGSYAKVLCDANTNLHLYCVDPWSAEFGNTQANNDRYFKKAQATLKGKNVTFVRKPSMEAIPDFEDKSLDFVFIDGKHTFDYVCPDIIFWSRKVRSGGIVACHDYYHFFCGGVVEAVDAYVHCHKINPWYVTYEMMPTAFWVQP